MDRLFSTFPPGTTNQEVFEQMFNGTIPFICECGHPGLATERDLDVNFAVCEGCKKQVHLPMDNPKYLEASSLSEYLEPPK